MSTILSLKDATDITGAHMTTETARDKVIIFRLDSGNIYKFKKFNKGLY